MKRASKLSLSILTASALLATACGPSSVPALEYFDVGDEDSRWEFDAHVLAGENENHLPGTGLMYADGTEVIDGITYTRSVMDLTGVPLLGTVPPTKAWSRISDEGVYTRVHPEKEESLETPFPVVLGKTWHLQDEEISIRGEYASLETVMIGHRIYNDCLKVVASMGSGRRAFRQTTHLAPGIGPVRVQFEYPNGIKLDMQLRDYQL